MSFEKLKKRLKKGNSEIIIAGLVAIVLAIVGLIILVIVDGIEVITTLSFLKWEIGDSIIMWWVLVGVMLLGGIITLVIGLFTKSKKQKEKQNETGQGFWSWAWEGYWWLILIGLIFGAGVGALGVILGLYILYEASDKK